ncbi:hypothetical protein G5C64_09035 [Vibrio diabolicus]|uniref:hypothetical protein n=1 Tax=Vibrio diabolicus TaxID=50719 RepID=UPI002150B299|nr:hypothetical protein [Vibrio diabolicus]MCE3218979.1 hypothetical protein [Vibrio diabolicus]
MEDVVLFKKKLSDVSLNFTVYTELFDSPEAVEAMNQFHPFIFGNYQKCLVRISVIAIARFGLFRSPDPAVFLSSYFYSK